MTDKEILEKALRKIYPNADILVEEYPTGFLVYAEEDGNYLYDNDDEFTVIFSHSFAKAFWGEEIVRDTIWFDGVEADDRSMPAWQYHLQQMVLEEEPLKYLEKFL